jgi:hypothetical protein
MKVSVMKQILHVLENVQPVESCGNCDIIGICGFCHEVEYRGHTNDCELIAAINALKSHIKVREICTGGTENAGGK